MHELGIMESAVQSAISSAYSRGKNKIHRLVLRVGALSGVEPESLRFAFDAVSQRTIAEGANLVLEVIPALAYCRICDADFAAATPGIFCCPSCGHLSAELRTGRELELAQIEIS